MRAKVALAIMIGLADHAAADTVSPPPIMLRVEQPAYTGMPVWLHLTVRDACLEHSSIRYPWFEYLWLRDDGALVEKDGHPVERTPFTEVDPEHRIRNSYLLPCVVSPPQGPEHDHLFALSGAYIFDQPGHYRVSWTTKHRSFSGGRSGNSFRGNGDVMMKSEDAASAWFDFTVEASTASQREIWLTKVLKQPPSDDDTLIYDYIPTLLAAWQDVRVTKKLLDMVCGHSQHVSIAASEALHYDLDQEPVNYFAKLVTNGCLPDDGFIRHFVQRHARELVGVREPLLRGFAAHLSKRWQLSDERVKTISALSAVRNIIPSTDADKAINAWADEQVLRASPALTANLDTDGMNYSQLAQGELISYFAHKDAPPAAHQLLRRLASGDVADLSAFEAVMAFNDPGDLEFFGTTLAKLNGMVWGNYLTDMDKIVDRFGDRAAPMLRVVASTGKDFNLREEAASQLMALRQPGGEPVIAAAMHSSYWVERRAAANDLDKLVRNHVALGSLARYCTGLDSADPCGARQIVTPPGKCEPHFACMVKRLQEDRAPN